MWLTAIRHFWEEKFKGVIKWRENWHRSNAGCVHTCMHMYMFFYKSCAWGYEYTYVCVQMKKNIFLSLINL